MRVLTSYACEVCGSKFPSAERALQCEALPVQPCPKWLHLGAPCFGIGERGLAMPTVASYLVTSWGYVPDHGERHAVVVVAAYLDGYMLSHNADIGVSGLSLDILGDYGLFGTGWDPYRYVDRSVEQEREAHKWIEACRWIGVQPDVTRAVWAQDAPERSHAKAVADAIAAKLQEKKP